ncbi:hypothetical protein DNTS_006529 [Danionella cerebrum]|uniref:Uncharacterized protein n=1 Tax=Danionella cerebrum TaxID=2873325 RepID=A0A553Q214_9TELE|nr:hypothetical protein DNTS_006529 [Danionella translucida]
MRKLVLTLVGVFSGPKCEVYLAQCIRWAEESEALGADRVTQLVASFDPEETLCLAFATHPKPKTFQQEWSFIMHTKPCFLWLNAQTSLSYTVSPGI